MTTVAASEATDPAAGPPDPPPTRRSRHPHRPSRWWIAAVPVSVVAMLAASGYRVPTFWYGSGLHHELASAEPGQWAEVVEEYSDAHGDTTRRYSVRLAGLGGADTAYEDRLGDELTLPEGMVARTVRLNFRAEPDQPLKSCAVTLVDDRGREYRVGHLNDAIGPRVHNCVPEDAPGPSVAVLEKDQRGATPTGEEPRPAQWSTTPAIAVPEDATLVELRISFEEPDYVTLTLPR